MTRSPAPPGRSASGRLPAIDIARSVALANMAAFHVGRDLDMVLPEALRVAPYGFSFGGAWQGWAMGIAGSFIFLAGVSLWLAHGRGIRWHGYARRLALLILAAGAVSAATYLTFPQQWVRFGILHSIAASSVIGLAFLRLPATVTLAAGAAILWAGFAVEMPAFGGAGWLWLGLSDAVPPMMDWEPLLPWTGPFLLGLGVAKLADHAGWLNPLRGVPSGPVWHALGWPGRHSLSIYLIHQPVIVGMLLGWAWLVQS